MLDTKLIVTIEGGVIQSITGNSIHDRIEIEIRDFDTEGVNEEELCNISGESCLINWIELTPENPNY